MGLVVKASAANPGFDSRFSRGAFVPGGVAFLAELLFRVESLFSRSFYSGWSRFSRGAFIPGGVALLGRAFIPGGVAFLAELLFRVESLFSRSFYSGWSRSSRESFYSGRSRFSRGAFIPGGVIPATFKIGTPVATLPGVWRCRVSAGTGRPGVSNLGLGEIETLMCKSYLSVAERKIV